jgi:hypothetical protein
MVHRFWRKAIEKRCSQRRIGFLCGPQCQLEFPAGREFFAYRANGGIHVTDLDDMPRAAV